MITLHDALEFGLSAVGPAAANTAMMMAARENRKRLASLIEKKIDAFFNTNPSKRQAHLQMAKSLRVGRRQASKKAEICV